MVIMVNEYANLLLRTTPDRDLYPILGGSCLNLVVGQYGTHQLGSGTLIQGAAKVIHGSRALFSPSNSGKFGVEGVCVMIDHLGIPGFQHVPENTAEALAAGKCAPAFYGEGVQVLETLGFRNRYSGQPGLAYRDDLPKGDIVIGVFHRIPIGEYPSTGMSGAVLSGGIRRLRMACLP